MRCLLVFWAVALALPSLGLAADTQENSYNLPEVLVTATATPAPAREVPVHVEVLSRDDIDQLGVDTLSELIIQKSPGTVVQYPGAYMGFSLRGFNTYDSPGANMDAKTLVLVDGNPFGSGNLTLIPLGNVERVEIMRGPGSVLYGASAMGGVINIITKRGKGTPSGSVEAEYGSFNRFQPKASAQGGTQDSRLGFSLAGRVTTVEQYDASGGWRYRNTDYHDLATSGTVTMTPVENHTFHLFGNYFNAWNMGDPGPTYSPTHTARIQDAMKNFAAIYDGATESRNVQWRLATWVNEHDYANTDTPYYERSSFTTNQVGIDGRVSVPTFSLGRFTIGGQYRDIREHRDGDGVYAPDSNYENLSIYGEEKVDIGDFTFLAGLRYDQYNLRILDNDSFTDATTQPRTMDHLSWRGGITWRTLSWLTLRTSAGSAFTPPDAYKFCGRYHDSWSNYIGNANLTPETSTTWEGGLDINWKGLEISGTYFYTLYTDAITTTSTTVNGNPYWQTWINSAGSQLAGLEGFTRYSHKFDIGSHRLSVTPFLNWIWYAQRKVEDSKLVSARGTDTVLNLSEYSLNPGVQFGFDSRVTLNLNGQWQGPQKVYDWDTHSANYGKVVDKDPFFVMNARLSIRPAKKLETYVFANNLGDERYSYVDGYPMPGRTFGVGVRYEF
ncbi:outer membrane insertion C-terminal signal protein [Solidesulfovibrio fructosivorans JJ]]|uniref:Outer membrane insertion C-terminal signal protein n=1 Tax=Solidesulfovibrio fructosivorans JJ] TaxID=596151 RepID=E1JWX2_SOLFR|nr:TonB-dependent receptor [Solidesulfovibrio fructosivorans]EFL51176.1 outer membrane insertion C-terminal signal protein [Solidesulfovibrio fructosivorans JJ]]